MLYIPFVKSQLFKKQPKIYLWRARLEHIHIVTIKTYTWFMCVKRDYKVSVLNTLINFKKKKKKRSVINRFVYLYNLWCPGSNHPSICGGMREETCLFCGWFITKSRPFRFKFLPSLNTLLVFSLSHNLPPHVKVKSTGKVIHMVIQIVSKL